jgi:hypothetical protein
MACDGRHGLHLKKESDLNHEGGDTMMGGTRSALNTRMRDQICSQPKIARDEIQKS